MTFEWGRLARAGSSCFAIQVLLGCELTLARQPAQIYGQSQRLQLTPLDRFSQL